jgi:hypothetical protein
VDGRAAFVPDAVAFIQSLPDDGNVNKDDAQQDGKIKEANLNLGAVFGGKKQNRESLRLG